MSELNPEQAALKGNAEQLAKILETGGTAKLGDTFEPSARSTPVLPAPAELAGEFPQLEIIELIGAGGMGMVYKARQPRLDRVVALKILAVGAGFYASFAERFSREGKALAKLNHPGIVAIYDFGQTSKYYYFIMEYVEGMNLRQLLKTESISPRHALELVIQICTALQYAHDEGIIHRDIKPENILINKRGRAKIADFGLAKLLNKTSDTTLTSSHMVMGSLNYMAPEQQEKPLTVDHRADIYSLGVVLYEMLTGELPIGRFAPPSQKIQVDVRFDEVVLRALEKDPDLRFQKVSEQKTAIEFITQGLKTPATDKPKPAKAKNRWIAGSVASAIFVSALAGWWFGWQRTQQVTNHSREMAANSTAPNIGAVQTAANAKPEFGPMEAAVSSTAIAAGMALIPAGSFTMGDTLDGESDAMPTVSVTVSAFYMDTNLVSYSQWQSVHNWATSHGYGFDHAGSGKATNHPVQTVEWYDIVKWSNARSQQAGLTPVYYTDAGLTQVYKNGEVAPYVNWGANGYRLPTEAEWEKAARGGLSGYRFPWGNTISESQANYAGDTSGYSYDLGPNGYNSIGSIGGTSPATSPVGSFAANGYGLYDMAGNVFEYCWDWWGTPYGQPTTYNPTGPATGINHVVRGGGWNGYAVLAHCAWRGVPNPVNANINIGFRCVREH